MFSNSSTPFRARPLKLEFLENRAVPATFTVTTTLDELTPGDGKLSLREAITRANDQVGDDVIVVPAGVFKIIAGIGVTDGVTIQGAGAGGTVVDAQRNDRVFDVLGTAPSSIRVVIEAMTTRNGEALGYGGGIRVGNADLVIRDCVIVGNRASLDGGGISNGAAPGTGDVKVVRTTVARNVAGAGGGGMNVTGSSVLTVKDSTVQRNIATGGSGGIRYGTATMTNCTVSGNSGLLGGGMTGATLTMTNCTVSGNSTPGSIGGIGASTAILTGCTVKGNVAGGNAGGIFVGSAVTLTNSTISGNVAGVGGGGIFAVVAATLNRSTVSANIAGADGGGINADTATLTNTTVSGNSATGNGGGLFADTATLLNDTIAENNAHDGGGIFHNPGGGFFLRNTIVALNLTDFGVSNVDVSGVFSSQGHNFIGDGTGGTGLNDGVNGDIVGTSDNPIDPKLGPLQNNGGPTKTMALLAGSRAIDHGDNNAAPASDQRGFARKKDGNFDGVAVVDIGAFEK
jgi:predicted outer membrane repeat protein